MSEKFNPQMNSQQPNMPQQQRMIAPSHHMNPVQQQMPMQNQQQQIRLTSNQQIPMQNTGKLSVYSFYYQLH